MKKTLLLFLLFPVTIFSQYSGEKIEIIGEVLTEKLPYGYPFEIHGKLPRTGITSVVFTLDGIAYTWNNAAGIKAGGEFVIGVGTKLKMGNSYTYSINYLPLPAGIAAGFAPNTITEDNPSKASRFFPVGGIGHAWLGTNPNMDTDMFGYAGLKILFSSNVDKRLKFNERGSAPSSAAEKVYKKPWDRLGIMVGGTITPLAYHGKALDNPVFNFKPIAALTIDIMPELSIDIGAVFFDYNRVDSSIKTEIDAEHRWAPFISLTLDADAFTRLRSVINGKAYAPK